MNIHYRTNIYILLLGKICYYYSNTILFENIPIGSNTL